MGLDGTNLRDLFLPCNIKFIQISVSVIKLVDIGVLFCLHVAYGCFNSTMAD